MNPTFPITLSESYMPILYSLPGYIILGIVLAFFTMLFFESLPILYIVVCAYILFCLYSIYRMTGIRLTLADNQITYNTRQKRYTFSYSDVEKIGYYTLYQPHGRGGSFYQQLRVFLKEIPNPIQIDMTAFSNQNMLLFLQILLKEAPHAQIGDSLTLAIKTGNFPRKMSMWGNEEDDTYFGSAEKADAFNAEKAKKANTPIVRIYRYAVIGSMLIFFMSLFTMNSWLISHAWFAGFILLLCGNILTYIFRYFRRQESPGL